jgi:hypothetical protein
MESVDAVSIVGSFEGNVRAGKVKRVPVNRSDFVYLLPAVLEPFFHPLQEVLFLQLQILQLYQILDLLV